MKTRYNYNRHRRLLQRIKDVFSGVRIFRSTSDELNARLAVAVYDTDDYKREPIADKEYLRGYKDCLWETLWQTELIFGYIVDGEILTTDEQFQKIGYSNLEKRCSHLGHFWKKDLKWFSVDTKENWDSEREKSLERAAELEMKRQEDIDKRRGLKI